MSSAPRRTASPAAAASWRAFALASAVSISGPQQFEVGGDHLQQLVEIVRHAAGELADRLQPLRGYQLTLD